MQERTIVIRRMSTPFRNALEAEFLSPSTTLTPMSLKNYQIGRAVEYGQQLVSRIEETKAERAALEMELEESKHECNQLRVELRVAKSTIVSLKAHLEYLEGVEFERNQLRDVVKQLLPQAVAKDDIDWLKRLAAINLNDLQARAEEQQHELTTTLEQCESSSRHSLMWAYWESHAVLENVALTFINKKVRVVSAKSVPAHRQVRPPPISTSPPPTPSIAVKLEDAQKVLFRIGEQRGSIENVEGKASSRQLENELETTKRQLREAEAEISTWKELIPFGVPDRRPIVKSLATLYTDVQWAATAAKVWKTGHDSVVVTRKEVSLLHGVLGQLSKNFQWLLQTFLRSDELLQMGLTSVRYCSDAPKGAPLSNKGMMGLDEVLTPPAGSQPTYRPSREGTHHPVEKRRSKSASSNIPYRRI